MDEPLEDYLKRLAAEAIKLKASSSKKFYHDKVAKVRDGKGLDEGIAAGGTVALCSQNT